MLMDQGHRHVWEDARILGVAAPFRLYCTPGCWPAMTEPAKAMVEYVRLIVAAARLASVKELKLGHCPPAFISVALIIRILQLQRWASTPSIDANGPGWHADCIWGHTCERISCAAEKTTIQADNPIGGQSRPSQAILYTACMDCPPVIMECCRSALRHRVVQQQDMEMPCCHGLIKHRPMHVRLSIQGPQQLIS